MQIWVCDAHTPAYARVCACERGVRTAPSLLRVAGALPRNNRAGRAGHRPASGASTAACAALPQAATMRRTPHAARVAHSQRVWRHRRAAAFRAGACAHRGMYVNDRRVPGDRLSFTLYLDKMRPQRPRTPLPRRACNTYLYLHLRTMARRAVSCVRNRLHPHARPSRRGELACAGMRDGHSAAPTRRDSTSMYGARKRAPGSPRPSQPKTHRSQQAHRGQ